MSSAAGWVGIHCRKHTVQVVRTMLKQVWRGDFAIYIQKFKDGPPQQS